MRDSAGCSRCGFAPGRACGGAAGGGNWRAARCRCRSGRLRRYPAVRTQLQSRLGALTRCSAVTYPCCAHVLDGGDFVAYSLQTLISIQLASAVSVLFNAPRRSSSRSVRQLMKERELLIRSVVNLILAIWYGRVLFCFAVLVAGGGVESLVERVELGCLVYSAGLGLLLDAGVTWEIQRH